MRPDLEVTPETSAEDVPEWDSLRHISIVVGAEEMFGIRFRTAELEELRNVGELTALIARRLAEKRGAAAGSVAA